MLMPVLFQSLVKVVSNVCFVTQMAFFISRLAGTNLDAHSPRIAEALGVREALSRLKNKSVSKVIVDSDSQVFVNAFHSSKVDLS